jgi:uncharacterized protein
MPDALLLLPPSEGKADGGRKRGRSRVPRSFPGLDPQRAEVARALAEELHHPARAQRLLGVKGAALDAAITANLALETGPVLPAIERYTGVLYDHLDAASLPAAARERLDAEVVIVSGLWGLVRPDDPLPDYKLKVDARLGHLGRLSTWWRPHCTPVLDRRARRALVWDLLPGAHAAVWADPLRTPALRITASFAAEERRGGELVRASVTHWSKALKGALARHLLCSDPVPPEREAVADLLGRFCHDGYRLDELAVDGTTLHATFVAPADRRTA